MKLFSRANVAAASFVVMLLGLISLNVMVKGGAESLWQLIRVIAGVTLFGFIFIRTSLLYLREGEPAKDGKDAAVIESDNREP